MATMTIGILGAMSYRELIAIAGLFTFILILLDFINPPLLYIGVALLLVGGAMCGTGQKKPEKIDVAVELKKVKLNTVGRAGLGVLAGGLLVIVFGFIEGGDHLANATPAEVHLSAKSIKDTWIGRLFVPKHVVEGLKPPPAAIKDVPTGAELNKDPL